MNFYLYLFNQNMCVHLSTMLRRTSMAFIHGYDLQKVQKLLQIESRTSTTITFTATTSMMTTTTITVLLSLLKVEPGWVVKC